MTADQLAEKVRLAICDCRVPPYGAAVSALSELVRRASERDQSVKKLAEQELMLASVGCDLERAEAERDRAVRTQLESENELASELAEERILHQQTIERADRLAAALERFDKAATDAFGDPYEEGEPGFGPDDFTKAHQIARDALAATEDTTAFVGPAE